MGAILGIGGFDHDGAVSLVRGDVLVGSERPNEGPTFRRADRMASFFCAALDVPPRAEDGL